MAAFDDERPGWLQHLAIDESSVNRDAGIRFATTFEGLSFMKRHLTAAVLLGTLSWASQATAQIGNVLFQENFNGLTLGPSVNERLLPTATAKVVSPVVAGTESIPNFFTHTPPVGWSQLANFNNFGHQDLLNPNYAVGDQVGNSGIGNAGNAGSGVDEWEGWSFTDFDKWITADTQQRELFSRAGNSIVAVVDPDEYDDLGLGLGRPMNYYNAGLSTNNISVAGKNAVTLAYDSSWRAEARDDAHVNPALFNGTNTEVNDQTVVVYASFDGATPVRVNLWSSDSNLPEYHGDNVDERVEVPITVPAGAQNMKLTFGMLNAGNDWWWAIDNLEVRQGANVPFWTENFESVSLGPSVNERLSRHVTTSNDDAGSTPAPNAFTHTPPANWTLDNTLMGGSFDDNVGNFEWEGWSFSTKEFSTFSGNTQLFGFEKSTGNYAIADSDAAGGAVTLNTVLQTPSVNLTGVAAGALKLAFDSAWQTSGAQNAVITVDYGSGETEVLNWKSDDTDPGFHSTNLNESVLVSLNNPAGATSAIVRFKYLDANNEWFWALDNIKIGTGGNADFDNDGDADGNDFLIWQRNRGTGTTPAQGDADGNGVVNDADLVIWKSQFGQTGLATVAAGAVPEPAAVALLVTGLMFVAGTSRKRR
ncbi:MAG: hypothetical protein C0485_14855 [Pirellula sp.]|nr:hypothetical protein [Pirellula sp.]